MSRTQPALPAAAAWCRACQPRLSRQSTPEPPPPPPSPSPPSRRWSSCRSRSLQPERAAAATPDTVSSYVSVKSITSSAAALPILHTEQLVEGS
ncbi:hypothetical protein CRUP_010322 [Coryphaenoides rupestris]|nr:hypothetical protein CRUP_010322 [Coryphaenoides rupestris]